MLQQGAAPPTEVFVQPPGSDRPPGQSQIGSAPVVPTRRAEEDDMSSSASGSCRSNFAFLEQLYAPKQVVHPASPASNTPLFKFQSFIIWLLVFLCNLALICLANESILSQTIETKERFLRRAQSPNGSPLVRLNGMKFPWL